MQKILHNPKRHAPAIYIPNWMSQVPVKLLSHGARLVYGRLSQWADTQGKAFRSAKDLAEELGMCESSVEKYQKELRKIGLIDTFHPQAGGVNHFEFYDHPWMHIPIKEQLVYKQDKFNPPYDHTVGTNPPYDHTVPPVSTYGTPPYDHTDINKKEIKLNKKTTTEPVQKAINQSQEPDSSSSSFFSNEFKSDLLRLKSPQDSRSLDEFLDNCKHHIENNSDQSLSLHQRKVGLKKLLINVEVFKSKGYVDIKKKIEQEKIIAVREQTQREITERKRLEMIESSKRPRKTLDVNYSSGRSVIQILADRGLVNAN